MADKLHLQLKPARPAYRLVWTETEDGWECGPLTVIPWKSIWGVWVWGVLLDGEPVYRPYGYTTARAAMAAAPHLGPVRRLMATNREEA